MKRKTLEQIYTEHRGKAADKWSLYLAEYDRIFGEYRDKPVSLLEIGVQNGGSLVIWSKYFAAARQIVGCDIDPACAGLTFDDPRIAVVVADADSDAAVSAVLARAPALDLVIDDGAHDAAGIVRSFARYFPHLADGGTYVVEDLHCSYWREFGGGLFDPYAPMAFFKRLADVLNHEHWGVDRTRADILKGFFSRHGFHMDEQVLRSVRCVEFINSLCVIRKNAPERNLLGRRLNAGSEASVAPGNLQYHSTLLEAPDQSGNGWTARATPPEEELPLRLRELTDLKSSVAQSGSEILGLRKTVGEQAGQIAKINRELAEAGEKRRRLPYLIKILFRQ